MTEFIEIEIEPTHVTSTGQRYRVWHHGEVLLESSKDPSHDAARELALLGSDFDSVILTYGIGDPVWRIRGRLGYFAANRTTEGVMSGPKVVTWLPYSGPAAKDDDD